MRQPLVLLLPASTSRNPVAVALRQRRADNVALRRALHQEPTKENE